MTYDEMSFFKIHLINSWMKTITFAFFSVTKMFVSVRIAESHIPLMKCVQIIHYKGIVIQETTRHGHIIETLRRHCPLIFLVLSSGSLLYWNVDQRNLTLWTTPECREWYENLCQDHSKHLQFKESGHASINTKETYGAHCLWLPKALGLQLQHDAKLNLK